MSMQVSHLSTYLFRHAQDMCHQVLDKSIQKNVCLKDTERERRRVTITDLLDTPISSIETSSNKKSIVTLTC